MALAGCPAIEFGHHFVELLASAVGGVQKAVAQNRLAPSDAGEG